MTFQMPQIRQKSVSELLSEAAALFQTKNAIYKDNYKRVGKIYLQLFPNGLRLETERDFNRFCLFFKLVDKLTRYAGQFDAGGHEDSLKDISVVAMMLLEIDNDGNQ